VRIEANRVLSLSVLAALLGVGLLGCGSSSKKSLKEVKAELDELKTAKSDVYAPEAFKAAKDAYIFAKVEMQEQQEKIALFRSYSHEEVLLTEARRAMEDAKEEAEAGRKEARWDAETLIDEAKRSLEAAEAMVARAPSQRRAAAQAALEDAGAVLFEAKEDLKGGSFLEAHTKAEDAKARVDEVIAHPGQGL
jgi:hypothetical protein